MTVTTIPRESVPFWELAERFQNRASSLQSGPWANSVRWDRAALQVAAAFTNWRVANGTDNTLRELEMSHRVNPPGVLGDGSLRTN